MKTWENPRSSRKTNHLSVCEMVFDPTKYRFVIYSNKMTAAERRSITSVVKALITGSHILHHHEVLDAYGHLSVRHPEKKNTFLMPRNIAPALLSSAADIIEYCVEDASPVLPNSPTGYVERYIHSEIYKRYPEINSVVHNHSTAVLPFTITGQKAPKFDIAQVYAEGDVCDLLIRTQRLGEHLAACFAQEETGESYNPVVLMRGHGFTAAGANIEESVFRAIYTAENARVQRDSLSLQLASGTAPQNPGEALHYLEKRELDAAAQMTQWSVRRPWELWERVVEANGLYVNNVVEGSEIYYAQ